MLDGMTRNHSHILGNRLDNSINFFLRNRRRSFIMRKAVADLK